MFDLIIIGGSAAATSAGIYAARRALNFRMITKDFGGEVATSGEVDNYPGIPGTNGIELADKFKSHLANYGVIPEEGVEVKKITRQASGTFLINAVKEGQSIEYVARAVIIATGVHPKELNISGEKEFRNKGVSYCTVCDGPVFGGKTVAIVGGGNSALEAGLMMADIASKVYILNKNPEFKGDTILLDNLKTKSNVEFIYNAKTTQIIGDKFVTSLKYDQGGLGVGSRGGALARPGNSVEREIKVDGVFVHIGMLPNSGVVPDDVQKNNFGEIMVDKNCQTNVPGLYAAGDVTDVPFKQIVIATGQGACAALSAVNYLNKLK